MIVRPVIICLFLLCGPLLWSEQQPQLSEGPAEVSIDFSGTIDADRSAVKGLIPKASHMIAHWLVPAGSQVNLGDPIIKWDTSRQQQEEAAAQWDLRWAKQSYALASMRAQRELQDLQVQLTEKLAELAVVTATITRLQAGDKEQLALLEAEWEREQRSIDRQRKELQRSKESYALGELSELDYQQRVFAFERAKAGLVLPQLRLQEAKAGKQTRRLQELSLKATRLRAEIGMDEAGQALDAGLYKRISGQQQSTKRSLAKHAATLERRQNDHQQLERAAWDHVPLRSVRFVSLADEQVALAVRFQGAEHAAPADGAWRVDNGLVYDAQRGFGWDQDRSKQLRWRAAKAGRGAKPGMDMKKRLKAIKDRMRAAGHKGPIPEHIKKMLLARAGGSAGAQASGAFGLCVVRGQAVWRCRLPNGAYRVEISLGDQSAWQGVKLSTTEACFFYAAELPAGQKTIKHDIEVRDGVWQLHCGDAHGKSMRSPGVGFAKAQPWVDIGRRSYRGGWPYAFFTPQKAVRVKAVIHQDLVPLLAVANKDASQSPSKGHAVASEVELSIAGKVLGTGRIKDIDEQPVRLTGEQKDWWDVASDDPKDLIGREILVEVSAELAQSLRLHESVRCRARITLVDDHRLVPGHLVRLSNDGPMVWAAAPGQTVRQRLVQGVRARGDWIITVGLEAGEQVHAPPVETTDGGDNTRRFGGTVVAGKRTVLGAGRVWGRVAEMIPEGSDVEAGDPIVTLRNPWLEERREELQEKKTKAKQDYLLAVQQRRVKAIDARIAHQDFVLKERESRLKLEEKREEDQVGLARAQVQWETRQGEHRLAAERLLFYKNLGADAQPRDLRNASLAEQRRALQLRKSQLDMIAQVYRSSWMEEQRAVSDWRTRLAALDQRDGAMRLAQREEEVSRLLSQQQLDRAMEGHWYEKFFAENKILRSPARGRVFYLQVPQDHGGGRGKVSLNVSLWSGMAVAEILDMSELAVEVELPEHLFGQIKEGMAVTVVFEQFAQARMPAVIHRIGRHFFKPSEVTEASLGEQAVGLQRVFNVQARFSPGPELRDDLVPGTKAHVELP